MDRQPCNYWAGKLMVRPDVLSAEEQNALQEHLNGCPKCATVYREYQRIIEDLQKFTATLHVPDLLPHLKEVGKEDALKEEEHAEREEGTNTRGVEVRIVVHRPAEKVGEWLLGELEGAELRIEELVKKPLQKVLGQGIKIEVNLRALEGQEGDIGVPLPIKQSKKYSKEEKAMIEATGQVFVLPFFADTVSEEAFSATTDLTGDRLLSVLDRLVQLDLLRPIEDSGRPGLYYSIKANAQDFIRTKLRDKSWFDEESARLRWGKYYVDFVNSRLRRERHQEDYWNTLVSRNLALIDPEWPNLRKVLVWADRQGQDQLLVDLMLGLVHYMDRRLLHQERLDYAQKAAKAAGRLGLSKREALFYIDALGWTLIEDGNLDDAAQQIKRGIDIVQKLVSEDPDAREIFALGKAYLAKVYLAKGDIDEALAFINEASRFRVSPVYRCRVQMIAGDIVRERGDYEGALEYYKKAQRETKQYSEEGDDFETDYRLGLAYLETGELGLAEKMFKAVIEREQKEGETIELFYAKYGMARIALINHKEDEFHRLVADVKNALTQAHTSYRLQAVLADLDLAELTELDPASPNTPRLPRLRAQELARLAQEQKL